MSDYKYIIIASHRRSGTHFLIDSLFNNFVDIKNGYVNLDRLLTTHNENLSISQFKKIISNRKKTILKTHTFGDFSTFTDKIISCFIKEEILPFAKIIYIHRDGKDVLNSLYYYLQSKGGKYKFFSEFIHSKNKFDNYKTYLNRIEFLREHKNSWEKRDVFRIEYEYLKNDYNNNLEKIAKYLNLNLNQKIIKIGIKKYNILQRGIRRIFPSMFISTAVLPRKGIIDDWKNNFSEKDLKYYNSIMNL